MQITGTGGRATLPEGPRQFERRVWGSALVLAGLALRGQHLRSRSGSCGPLSAGPPSWQKFRVVAVPFA